ncbi:dockerin type I domain-containing protein, partial [Robinsoniella sp.]
LAELTEDQHKVADVNGDGNSDSTDAAAILQYAAEKIDKL